MKQLTIKDYRARLANTAHRKQALTRKRQETLLSVSDGRISDLGAQARLDLLDLTHDAITLEANAYERCISLLTATP